MGALYIAVGFACDSFPAGGFDNFDPGFNQPVRMAWFSGSRLQLGVVADRSCAHFGFDRSHGRIPEVPWIAVVL